MTDQPQHEADVQLVLDAMAEACCHCPPGSRCHAHGMEAEAAVDALAKAHRLRMTPAELDALTRGAYEDGRGDSRRHALFWIEPDRDGDGVYLHCPDGPACYGGDHVDGTRITLADLIDAAHRHVHDPIGSEVTA